MAPRMAPSSCCGRNGFVRNSTAPAFIARTDIGISPWPVRKMIGTGASASARARCKSRPLRPGSRTSSTRQPGASGRSARMNSCAPANVCTLNPADAMSRRRLSRTAGSSSTTKTTGAEAAGSVTAGDRSALGAAARRTPSGRAERAAHGLEQGRAPNRLFEERHRAAFERLSSRLGIAMGGQHDDRNAGAAAGQDSEELEPADAPHPYVQYDAADAVAVEQLEERFRGLERLDGQSDGRQQVAERPTK